MRKIAIYISLCCAIMLISNGLNAQIQIVNVMDTVVRSNDNPFNCSAVVTEHLIPENSYYEMGLIGNIYEIKYYDKNFDEDMNKRERYDIYDNESFSQFSDIDNWQIFKVVPTKKIFNSDDDLEFIVTIKNSETNKISTYIFDQNGVEIRRFGVEENCESVDFTICLVDGKYGLVYSKEISTNISYNGNYYETHLSFYKIEGVEPDYESIDIEYRP